jgi:two-component system invasion response regulator UvrY
MNILLVDDHPIVRRGVAALIGKEYPNTSFGEAAGAAEAMAAVATDRWDLVVLDISLPGRNGLEILRDIRATRPRLPVLVFSAHSEQQYAVKALQSGASGYLTKENASQELLKAVRRILTGGRYLSQAAADLLAAEPTPGASQPLHQRLSSRECAVMTRLARGVGLGEISNALNLSAKTVSTYRDRILLKMGLKTNADLIHYAFRNGLVD